MASQNTYPPPPPPPPPVPPPQYQYPAQPPYRCRRSIAGPLVLIVIGLIFLLRNFGIRFPIWHFFGRWWPLLLILWGLIALIEHATSQRMGYRTRHLGAGGIFLLILLVALGVSAHYSSDIDWGGVRNQMQMDDDLGGIFGTAFTFDDTLQQAFPAHGDLRVVCDHGSLNIAPSDDNTLRIVVHKKVYAQNQKDADKYNEGTKPQITVSGNSVVLNANTNGAGQHGVQADMDIFVPRDATLDVAAKNGDVTVNDRKADVKITLQHGDVTLNDVAGAVNISLKKGSVRASKIAGDMDVDGNIDNVTIDEVAGAVHLNGDFFEDIRLNKIAKTVTFKSSRSDMQIASVPGGLEIVGDEVRGTDLNGPSRLITRSKDIRIENVSGDLQLETTNGDIEVHTSDKLPLGRISISSKRGDISLALPPKSGFQVQANTNKGSITSEFDAVKVDESNGSASASGAVGSGVSKLQINTDTGDIRITKG